MADMIHAGIGWLSDKLAETCSRAVVYYHCGRKVRGPLDDGMVNAVVGRTTLEFSNEVGQTKIEATDRDYIIRAADLAEHNKPFDPQKGDRIKDGEETFEVMGLSGDPEYRKSDAFGLMLRIHCKQVK